eukprot:1273523-Rhodomonas_salina.1
MSAPPKQSQPRECDVCDIRASKQPGVTMMIAHQASSERDQCVGVAPLDLTESHPRQRSSLESKRSRHQEGSFDPAAKAASSLRVWGSKDTLQL